MGWQLRQGQALKQAKEHAVNMQLPIQTCAGGVAVYMNGTETASLLLFNKFQLINEITSQAC